MGEALSLSHYSFYCKYRKEIVWKQIVGYYKQLILPIKSTSLPWVPCSLSVKNSIVGRENSNNKVSLVDTWQSFKVSRYAGWIWLVICTWN